MPAFVLENVRFGDLQTELERKFSYPKDRRVTFKATIEDNKNTKTIPLKEMSLDEIAHHATEEAMKNGLTPDILDRLFFKKEYAKVFHTPD